MKTIISLLGVFGFLFGAPLPTEMQSFRIDSNHSTIGFAVPIQKGLSKVHGKFSDFKINLDYNEKDITKSSVNVVIQAKSIDSGIDQRDNHLRTPDFFAVEQHPEITFKSKKIIKKGNKLTLVGDFTMRGVTKEISFPFRLLGKSISDLGERGKMYNLGFEAKFKINRTDFGVNYQHKVLPNFISNEVEIFINLITLGKRLEEPK